MQAPHLSIAEPISIFGAGMMQRITKRTTRPPLIEAIESRLMFSSNPLTPGANPIESVGPSRFVAPSTSGGTKTASVVATLSIAAQPAPLLLTAGKVVRGIVVDTTSLVPSGVAKQSQGTLRATLESSNGTTVWSRIFAVKDRAITLNKIRIRTAGRYTLIVSDGQGDSVSQSIIVNAGAAARLVFTSLPSNLYLPSTVTAQVDDAFGNLTAGDDGNSLNLQLAHRLKLVPDAELTGTLTAVVSGGVASFTDVAFNETSPVRLSITGDCLRQGVSPWIASQSLSAGRPWNPYRHPHPIR